MYGLASLKALKLGSVNLCLLLYFLLCGSSIFQHLIIWYWEWQSTMSFNEWRKVIFRQGNGKVKSLLESDDDFPGCQHVSYY